jgi:hypothetical protein
MISSISQGIDGGRAENPAARVSQERFFLSGTGGDDCPIHYRGEHISRIPYIDAITSLEHETP